jgi:hypothetical protein
MAATIWVLLGLAYVWSVWRLARMSHEPDPWSAEDSPRIDVVRVNENPGELDRTTARLRTPLVAFRR